MPTAETVDRLAAFSEALATLYEAQIDPSRVGPARHALKELMGADEVVLAPGTEASSAASDSENPLPSGARSNGRALWLDLAETPSGPVRILFRRHADNRPFTEADMRMLALLRRHLRTAYGLKLLTDRDVLGCLASAQLVQSMQKGLVITDAECQIRWRNRAAAEILADDDGLADDKGRLRTRRAFESAHLENLVRAAAGGTAGVMLVARPSENQPYGLALAPMKTEAPTLLPEPRTRGFVLITIKEVQREMKLITGRLGALFGFTPAEEKLGALLLDGCTLQDAAQCANKALPTVKTQLRSMLKKTGARSQAELMNMFLSLPSII